MLLHLTFFALAAVVVRFGDLQTMAWDSDLVVHAVATDRVVERDSGGRIVTWTELTVVETRSAAPVVEHGPETLWLAQLGGQLDGETLSIPGSVTVDVGEEIVLFAMTMPGWPTVIIPHTLGAGLFRVDAGLSEEVGDIVTASGTRPAPRRVEDIDTLWRQTGLPQPLAR